ncbi:MAG: SUMF1/EgtB/PvdO family nonheme iron enzyme [Polyangiaceae bacterium]|nr:SUMF1/EgtB/PvdO family nonheme iron enzyme [Polyangiaceae bacterium]
MATASNASATPSGAPSAPASSSAENGAPAPSASATTRAVSPPLPEEDVYPTTLDEQREAMLRRMKTTMRLDDGQIAALHGVLEKSKIVGQGNPEICEYAMTRKECRERREAAGVIEEEEPICGGPFMSPLWNPKAGETKANAKVCIDRYEFPGVPCEYPVTWVSSREAALMCKAVGKRICDAHEWEGACAGALLPAESEYAWKLPRKESRHRHNESREIVWAYGAEKNFDKCAMSSHKSKKCEKSGWKVCGSNTYPSGAFPECKSAFGVYDQHGNVAEHMNLPLRADDLGSHGGAGGTEMKGSWFIFKSYEAHIDDCRWRAPDWHGTKLMSHDSHQNYHLGFRCCKDVEQ